MTIDPHIFREYDIRGIAGVQLTDESVASVGRALGTYFRRNGAARIAIGYDARESSSRFCDILVHELTAAGCDVVRIGMVPTPVLYYAVHTMDVDGGVMITGSHDPPDHNGFKICLGKHTLFGAEIQGIHEIASSGDFFYGAGTADIADVFEAYLDDLAAGFEFGERQLKVIVDAGNGMGGVTAVELYRRLGVEVVGLHIAPDPTFPNHHPDPTVAENLGDLIAAVAQNNADLGIAFDGDGDRLGIVDETGRIVWGDELLTLFARSVLEEWPGSIVIAEAKCSQTLFDDIELQGGVPLMWKAGHSIIKAKMQETGALLAGEMSGHFFFADRFYGFDDACYAGARLFEILSKTDRPLSALLADLPRMVSTPEIRVACPDGIKFDVVRQIAEKFARDHSVNTIDGARITFDHGWGIVRASNTQELLILRFEADTPEHLDAIRSEIGQSVTRLIDQAG